MIGRSRRWTSRPTVRLLVAVNLALTILLLALDVWTDFQW